MWPNPLEILNGKPHFLCSVIMVFQNELDGNSVFYVSLAYFYDLTTLPKKNQLLSKYSSPQKKGTSFLENQRKIYVGPLQKQKQPFVDVLQNRCF